MPLQIVLAHLVVVYSYADFLQIVKYSSSLWMLYCLLKIEIVHYDAAQYYSNEEGKNVVDWIATVS